MRGRRKARERMSQGMVHIYGYIFRLSAKAAFLEGILAYEPYKWLYFSVVNSEPGTNNYPCSSNLITSPSKFRSIQLWSLAILSASRCVRPSVYEDLFWFISDLITFSSSCSSFHFWTLKEFPFYCLPLSLSAGILFTPRGRNVQEMLAARTARARGGNFPLPR